VSIKARRFWQSLKRGLLVTSVVYFVVDFIAVLTTHEPILPLLKSFPLAWLWYWPKIFYARNAMVTDRDFFISFGANTVAYTTAIYMVSYFRHALKLKEAKR